MSPDTPEPPERQGDADEDQSDGGLHFLPDRLPRHVMRQWGLGMEFILHFGLPLAGGLLLDVHLGTLPGFTLAGALGGFVLGLVRLVKAAREMESANRSGKREDDA